MAAAQWRHQFSNIEMATGITPELASLADTERGEIRGYTRVPLGTKKFLRLSQFEHSG